jgi:hypothetical protein
MDAGRCEEIEMRYGIIVSAALTALSATSARANEWCGYTARPNAMIECGYSTATECENNIGKGAMCFVDPDYALNNRHAAHTTAPKASARQG